MKNLEDCDDVQQQNCHRFNRILVDMNPRDTYDFLLAVSAVGSVDGSACRRCRWASSS